MIRKHKTNKPKIELPYKKTISSKTIVEDVEKATNRFSGGTNNTSTGKYEMIIVASLRGRDLLRGATPMVDSDHKPTVTALLEIEAGFVGKNYVSQTVARRL